MRLTIIASLLFSLALSYPGTKVVLKSQLRSEADYVSYIKYLQILMENDYIAEQHCFGKPHHHFFDGFPVTHTCPERPMRYPPGTEDGGKFGCALSKTLQRKACVIYSYGSQGNYLFEKEMLQFKCEIHTFDCFGDFGRNAPGGVRFHKWCAGDTNSGDRYTIPAMMNMLGHKKVDYLKMDIEGDELKALPLLRQLPRDRLPSQIAVEIHPLIDRSDALRSIGRLRSSVNLLLLFHELGYRMVTREDNFIASCCSEYVFVLPERLPKSKSALIGKRAKNMSHEAGKTEVMKN